MKETRYQRQVRAWTGIITIATFAGLLMYDWDTHVGHHNVFSGIRPKIKSVLNRLYGVEPSKANDTNSSSQQQ
jgi:hypothetical protein